MKTNLYWLLFLLLPACTPKAGKPHLVVRHPVVEAGELLVDSLYSFSYTLVNEGDAPVVIDTVSAGCSCTVLQEYDHTIAPGDSMLLRVEFRPADTGVFDKKVVIKSNTAGGFEVLGMRGRAGDR